MPWWEIRMPEGRKLSLETVKGLLRPWIFWRSSEVKDEVLPFVLTTNRKQHIICRSFFDFWVRHLPHWLHCSSLSTEDPVGLPASSGAQDKGRLAFPYQRGSWIAPWTSVSLLSRYNRVQIIRGSSVSIILPVIRSVERTPCRVLFKSNVLFGNNYSSF